MPRQRFAALDDRQWWGGLQADRRPHSDLASQAVDAAVATPDNLKAMSRRWREGGSDTARFAVLHGEILARAPHRGRPAMTAPPLHTRGVARSRDRRRK